LPPSNDLCLAPTQLFSDGGSLDTVSGSTRFATDNYTNGCLSSGTRDVVYGFTTTSAQKFTATLKPTDAGYRGAVFVREATACLTDGGLVAAADAGPGCYDQ